MYKYIFSILLFLTFVGCENNSNDPIDYSKINGTWEKDGVYLIFSNEFQWKCLVALNNSAPMFNGDEEFAFPDGFVSFDEYKAAKISLEYCFEGNNGYLELTNKITLSDKNKKYKINIEIGKNKIVILNNIYLDILFDNNLYRPFNPLVRSSYSNGISSFNLVGTWNKIVW